MNQEVRFPSDCLLYTLMTLAYLWASFYLIVRHGEHWL